MPELTLPLRRQVRAHGTASTEAVTGPRPVPLLEVMAMADEAFAEQASRDRLTLGAVLGDQ
jgi:hypothetical protein